MLIIWESSKLGNISESIVQLGNEDIAGFKTVSSQISQTTSELKSEVNAGFSTVSSQVTISESANEARHQAVVAQLRDHTEKDNLNTKKMNEVFQQQTESMDMNQTGFQAVRSSLITVSSSNSEEHKTTHEMLSQCQSQLQQIFRNHITFGTVRPSVHSPSHRFIASNPITSKAIVFWQYWSYRMPIGMLRISLKQTQQMRNSGFSTAQGCTESDIEVEFVPPRWLSSFLINYSMKLSHDLNSDHWRWGTTLKPLTVNYNSRFIEAVECRDVEGIQRSFAEGLAKPTDYILDNYGCEPWYRVSLQPAFSGEVLNLSCSS